MKYRRLSQEELAPLNEEFLKYLLVANITPEQWEELKQNNLEACGKHLDVFSDLVFEKILDDIHFVDRILPKRIEVYHFMSKSILMYALEPKEDDFTFDEGDLGELDLKRFELTEGKKIVHEDRKGEVFSIIQLPNAKISDGMLYKQFALKIAAQKDQTK